MLANPVSAPLARQTKPAIPAPLLQDMRLVIIARMHRCSWCGGSFDGRKRKYCDDWCAAEAKLAKGRKRSNANPHLIAPAGYFWCERCRQFLPSEDGIYRRGKPCKCRACKREERVRLRPPKPPRKPPIERGSFKAAQNKLASKNAGQAWRYWMTARAPDWWIDRYYRALGCPWSNPRLSPAEQYAERYRGDPAFRHKEIARSRIMKGKRRRKSKVADDGTADYDAILQERKTCPYCGVRLTEENRTVDHIDPLSKNGTHSASNLTVCCRSCNSTKRAMPIWDWIETLPPRYQRSVRRLFLAKRGAPPEQSSLPFSGPQ